jgi:SSS family solute:Na+ symporter
MQLNWTDWGIVAASIAVGFSPVLFFARRAGKATAEFFASGRAAPWWLIGTSMVATTFSTDTPNLVTNLVRTGGVAHNWVWWAFLLTGMATVFFYARLWRRSRVLTDLEFYELRYSGKSAAFVRGFRSIYLGLLFNCVIMASVTLAAAKIANVMLGWGRLETVVFCSAVCIVFAGISGLWGVLTTDMIQFVIAMVGVFAAAVYALHQPQVGGLAGLLDKIDPKTISLLPDFNDWGLAVTIFIIPLAVQWWSVWYPGAEPGGGSYIAQRMLAAKDERHALGGTLWFNVAHYALRPWPWIIVALCSMLVFPTLQDLRHALPHVSSALVGDDMAFPAMLTLLPHGLLGLLVAGLFAAYVSTMSTHLNWGSSYLVHDFYRRFIRGDASEVHYVWVSRLVTAVLMILAALLMFLLTTAKDAFDLMLSIGAGTGLIYLLRWFWWRINAWSEISAMVASFLSALGFFIARRMGAEIPTHISLVSAVLMTSVVWLVVTYLTRPASHETLVRFYKLVRPAGPGWNHIRAEAGVQASPDSIPQALLGLIVGCVFVYSALFGAGSFIYGHSTPGIIYAALFVVSGAVLLRIVSKIWRAKAASP